MFIQCLFVVQPGVFFHAPACVEVRHNGQPNWWARSIFLNIFPNTVYSGFVCYCSIPKARIEEKTHVRRTAAIAPHLTRGCKYLPILKLAFANIFSTEELMLLFGVFVCSRAITALNRSHIGQPATRFELFTASVIKNLNIKWLPSVWVAGLVGSLCRHTGRTEVAGER